jgi:hypothetical protein
MTKEKKECNDKINEFYQYLEQRLEEENQIEKEIIFKQNIKTDEIHYKKEKRQPIPATI